MAKAKQQTVTAQTMVEDDLPEGRRPEEFLTDADLVGFYERKLDSMKDDDPKRASVKRQLRAARIGAAAIE